MYRVGQNKPSTREIFIKYKVLVRLMSFFHQMSIIYVHIAGTNFKKIGIVRRNICDHKQWGVKYAVNSTLHYEDSYVSRVDLSNNRRNDYSWLTKHKNCLQRLFFTFLKRKNEKVYKNLPFQHLQDELKHLVLSKIHK